MISNGSPAPVQVTFSSPVMIEADEKYEITARRTKTGVIWSGQDLIQVPGLEANQTVSSGPDPITVTFSNSSKDSLPIDYKGQIPSLFFTETD